MGALYSACSDASGRGCPRPFRTADVKCRRSLRAWRCGYIPGHPFDWSASAFAESLVVPELVYSVFGPSSSKYKLMASPFDKLREVLGIEDEGRIGGDDEDWGVRVCEQILEMLSVSSSGDDSAHPHALPEGLRSCEEQQEQAFSELRSFQNSIKRNQALVLALRKDGQEWRVHQILRWWFLSSAAKRVRDLHWERIGAWFGWWGPHSAQQKRVLASGQSYHLSFSFSCCFADLSHPEDPIDDEVYDGKDLCVRGFERRCRARRKQQHKNQRVEEKRSRAAHLVSGKHRNKGGRGFHDEFLHVADFNGSA